MITSQNITSHEFIGLEAQVIHSSNPQVIGINGRIIEETKSMLKLETKNGIKQLAKIHNDWKFRINNEDIIVNGSKIAKRSFDRLGVKAWAKTLD